MSETILYFPASPNFCINRGLHVRHIVQSRAEKAYSISWDLKKKYLRQEEWEENQEGKKYLG